MVKSRVAENGRQIKRGNKKKKRKGIKIFLFVLLFFIIILGAVGGKVYFDLKTAVTKAYVNPPTQMTSVSLKKKEAFTTAILGISKIDGKDVLVSANLAATNPRLQQTTVINLSTSAILPDKQTLLTVYNSKGEAAVIKEMEKLLQVKINKFVGMNFDQMGELVQAIGGVSIQNANEFTAQGFKFPQGTVVLNKAEEVAAYFTLLNAGDTKKAFARQQEILIPMSCNRSRMRTVSVGCSIAADSVISNIRFSAFSSKASMMPRTSMGRLPLRIWIAEMLIAMRRLSSPASRKSANWRQAAHSTHSPIGWIKPVSSAMPMKRPGISKPFSGCCQRTSASTLHTRPLTRSMTGW